MTAEQAEALASDWIAAWNAHDLDRILAQFSEEVVFSSPYAVRLVGTPSGVIEGREALRTFIARGLAAYPDLHFKPFEVLPGAGSIALRYASIDGREAIQILELDRAGKIRRAASHFTPLGRVAAPAPAAPVQAAAA